MKERYGRLVLPTFLITLLLVLALPGETQDLSAREQQLRQRVNEIYRLFVSGEWRKVEQYVSEDTRDPWFAQPKSTIDSFEIKEIKVAPDGTKADVTVMATFRVPQAALPFTMPQKGEWVFEEGLWFLKIRKPPTLFEMFQATGAPSNPQTSQSPFVFDQNPVLLPKSEGTSEIVVKVPFQNVNPNVVTVQELSTTCACLKAEMDKLRLNPEEHAILTVTYHNTSDTAPPARLAIQALILSPAVYQLELPVVLQDQ